MNQILIDLLAESPPNVSNTGLDSYDQLIEVLPESITESINNPLIAEVE